MSGSKQDEKVDLTEEEHIARAMLLGLCYHHGNGHPFYWDEKNFDPATWVDANTLEPLGHTVYKLHDEIRYTRIRR